MWFRFASPWLSVMLNILSYLLAICMYSMEEHLFGLSAQSLIELLAFLLWVVGILYIFLKILTPYQIYDLQIFSSIWKVTFLFCWWFLYRRFLAWCNPICLFFAFVAFLFGVKSKLSSPRSIWSSLLLMFTSRSFMVSGLRFNSYIHFEFIFGYGVR